MGGKSTSKSPSASAWRAYQARNPGIVKPTTAELGVHPHDYLALDVFHLDDSRRRAECAVVAVGARVIAHDDAVILVFPSVPIGHPNPPKDRQERS